MRTVRADLIYWNEINFVEFRTEDSKVVALSLVMPPLSIFPGDVVVSRIKPKERTTFIDPSRFTLYAPESPLSVLNH